MNRCIQIFILLGGLWEIKVMAMEGVDSAKKVYEKKYEKKRTVIATYEVSDVKEEGQIMLPHYAEYIGEIVVYKNGGECKKLSSAKIDGELLQKYKFDGEGEWTLHFLFQDKFEVVEGMFENCGTLKKVSFSCFDDFDCEGTMEKMFCACPKLVEVDFEGFNSSKFVSMRSLFCGCDKLKKVNCEKLCFSKVEDLSEMFYRCASLEEVSLEGCDFSLVSDMSQMFKNCYKLKRLNFNVTCNKKLTIMYQMFCSCFSLSEVSLKGLNTSNVVNMNEVFYKCTALEKIDLSNWSFESVNGIEFMFALCTNLRFFIPPNTWAAPKKDVLCCAMFMGCKWLKGGIPDFCNFNEFKSLVELNTDTRCCYCC